MNPSSTSPQGSPFAFDQAVQQATQGKKGNPMRRWEDLKIEDLVLKRSWLARYWGLAAKLGVYPNIAHKKHAFWASVAPLPLEVVISAGQKAKGLATERPLISHANSKNFAPDESTDHALTKTNDKSEEQTPLIANKESGIDNQLLAVEEGLRELTELKVEEAVLLKISQNQNPSLIWFGLSREQAQDIRFKQAWLVHYWRRAHVFGVADEDVAEERLVYWMNQTNKPPSYQDVVSVQRGLWELRSLGIDSRGRLDGLAFTNVNP